MKNILITDPTLRDGSHAVGHQISAAQIAAYCKAADAAGIPIVEVGHGNGMGASSLQVGLSLLEDGEMLKIARENLTTSKLEIFVLPGFATINKDLKPALEAGVDAVRVAAHCTEADITERHISFVREKGKLAYGCLMMTHMVSKETLLEEARKMESYGAQGVILMDSAGAYLPQDVKEKVGILAEHLNVPVGFHAHNNLSMAVANSVAAVEAGASILDGTAKGFGAGAGNTPIEILVAVLEKMGYSTGIDLYKVLDASDVAEKELMKVLPSIKPISVISGLAGVFAGFSKHVERVATEYKLDPRDIFFELGKRKVVAGQEDLIVEVAIQLSQKRKTQ
ncbi:MAG: 4-hydroxy-2-oxovalerate aldolase [Elusimicrobia bacterium]|nr:4-hydroxy-2-oxovalerate aldolase [Elusimicrobiota bacterium]